MSTELEAIRQSVKVHLTSIFIFCRKQAQNPALDVRGVMVLEKDSFRPLMRTAEFLDARTLDDLCTQALGQRIDFANFQDDTKTFRTWFEMLKDEKMDPSARLTLCQRIVQGVFGYAQWFGVSLHDLIS